MQNLTKVITKKVWLASLNHSYTFFYKKNVYKKISLKNYKTLRKLLRKSPASNASAAIFKKRRFFLEQN